MTPRISFIFGTRPEIIKLSPLIRACGEHGIDHTTIHTGQHYSNELNEVFFEDLELPTPDANLAVGSGSHAEQTAEMMLGIEQYLREDDPDVVVVQGDTNSALAGGLVASKRAVELAHVEAGLRSFNREMPEEHNRVLLDHAAEYLFAPTEQAATYLREEGVPEARIDVTGNTVVDAVEQHTALAEAKSDVLDTLGLGEVPFALLTAHRPGNVDDAERFAGLLAGVARYAEAVDMPVVYPIHPRSAEMLSKHDLTVPDEVRLADPLNFLDFLRLESTAAVVFTDSGGVQEEACILGTPCVTIRESTERPETLSVGSNVLADPTPSSIVRSAFEVCHGPVDWDIPFGDGNSAEHILDRLGVDTSATLLETQS